MSDSELSDAPSLQIPPDSELETALRSEVKKAVRREDEEPSVTTVRQAAEKVLGLPSGFFKQDEKWKSRSKDIIKQQFEQDNTASSPEPAPQSKTKPMKKSQGENKKPAKRSSSDVDPRPVKKTKIESSQESSALSSPPSDSEPDMTVNTKPNPKKRTKNDGKPVASKPKPGHVPGGKVVPKPKEDQDSGSNKMSNQEDGSESGLSVVLDEESVKKPRRKGKSSEPSGQKPKAAKAKAKPKTSADVSPDQEEIKKLQGWLVKCGVRKVWGKELKPYETTKAKIRHLKEMLADVGLTGRFSNEKAAQIKESRELAADMEAVQEGNERWGKSGSDDDGDEAASRGGRRLVRGAKNYDFLSSDGEETD